MEDTDLDQTAKAIERLGEDPALADFAATWQTVLIEGSEDLATAVVRLGDLIGASSERFTLVLRVVHERAARGWSLEAGPERCTVTDRETAGPDLELILSLDSCRQLLNGRMSPLEAFCRGRMRVRGDLRLAREICRRLRGAGSHGSL
jgi:putative sterol carrier protein